MLVQRRCHRKAEDEDSGGCAGGPRCQGWKDLGEAGRGGGPVPSRNKGLPEEEPQTVPQQPLWPDAAEEGAGGTAALERHRLPAELGGHGPGSPLPARPAQHPTLSLLAAPQRRSPWSCRRGLMTRIPPRVPAWVSTGRPRGLRGPSLLHTYLYQLFLPLPKASGDTTCQGFGASSAQRGL